MMSVLIRGNRKRQHSLAAVLNALPGGIGHALRFAGDVVGDAQEGHDVAGLVGDVVLTDLHGRFTNGFFNGLCQRAAQQHRSRQYQG